jgi:hypothetical protein
MLNIAAGAPASTGYNLTRSLRFRASASASLNRTAGTATNEFKWTWSGWVKRGSFGTSQVLLNGYQDDNNLGNISFVDESLQMARIVGGSVLVLRKTNAVFRDPSAWYHIVCVFDNANATVANRVQIYVNGVLQTYSISNDPSTTGMAINVATRVQRIGRSSSTASPFSFDGYMAEVNFVDGQALTPASFGSTNALTGVWQPAPYTGTYGTNGFYLPFTDNSTAAALGTDFSGNSNTWTVNNISVTAGVTYDSMTDVPTLTGATAANFCTLNPNIQRWAVTGAGVTNGNLSVSNSSASTTFTFGTINASTGKWYYEATCTAVGSSTPSVGVIDERGQNTVTTARVIYISNGNKTIDNTSSAYGATYTTNDVIGVAYDLDAGQITFYKNNVSQGAITMPVTVGILPLISNLNSSSFALNFGQRPFAYTPPTGFVALNTFNLPAATIVKGNTVMDATLYTGTGASLAVTNAGAFQPDLVWAKSRSAATDHALYDSVRGVQKQIESNTATAETTETTGLTAFGSGGFTVGALAQVNTNAATYVGWQWKAGGAAVSNTDGTITSQVSANANAGFSVVAYTGTGANATVGHGLGVAPSMVIVKTRESANEWIVGNANLTSWSRRLLLNDTVAEAVNTTHFNSTAPTSSVFSVGASAGTNESAKGMVAYCFAEIAGFSKFGSYTGNANANGPFVYTGFRPRFVLMKRTDSTSAWYINDTSRSPANDTTGEDLQPNSTNAEAGTVPIDILSNGFKIRTLNNSRNAAGGTFIYMALAENPFKFSLAR